MHTDVRRSATEQLPTKYRKMLCLVEGVKERVRSVPDGLANHVLLPLLALGLAGNEVHKLEDAHNVYSNLIMKYKACQ